jgi:hypothetical protein
MKSMDINEFVPFNPVVQLAKPIKNRGFKDKAPLTMGNKISCTRLSHCDLSLDENGVTYSVPTGCSTKNYRRPCGLGSTLVSNTVVLMYPDVQQYLVPSELREPSMDDIGFLCCSSSPSSASTKGIIRYLASGTVMRSYTVT